MSANEKILILFNKSLNLSLDETGTIIQKITKVSDQNIDEIPGIVKDLKWNTKYYNALYDIYIDETDNFDEWLLEIQSDEAEILRKALAGIIYIGQYDKDNQSHIDKFGNLKCKENSFVVWYHYVRDESEKKHIIDDDKLELINEDLITNENSCEVVIHQQNKEKIRNEYGELLGVYRLHEIIDTYPWENRNLTMPNEKGTTTQKTAIDTKSNSEFESKNENINMDIDIQTMMNKIAIAKQKFNTMDDNEEAQKFALNMADELAALLIDDDE